MRDHSAQLEGPRRLVTLLSLAGSAVLSIVLLAHQHDVQGASSTRSTAPVHAQINKRDPLAVNLEKRLQDDIQPLVSKYCYECHGNGKKKGGVKLDNPGDIKSIMNGVDDWLTVVEVMNLGLMPPEDRPQPTGHEKLTIQQWVDDATDYYPVDAPPDPGWYTIHRLNRNEYRNTLRDLLGIDLKQYDPAEHLPPDNTGYGFDNIADVLSMSPLQLEKFIDAAEGAVEHALGYRSIAEPKPVRRFEGSNVGQAIDGGGFHLWGNGVVTGDYHFPEDGIYRIAVTVAGDFADSIGPRVSIEFGEQVFKTVDITQSANEQPQVETITVQAKAGRQAIGVRFLNDAVIEVDGEKQDRNLYVNAITVAGPLHENMDRTAYSEIFFVQPTMDDKGNRLPDAQGNGRISESQAAQKVLERFATRAFRRRANAADVTALMRVYEVARKDGRDYEQAMRLSLTASLVSPNFLYRPIANPKPDDPAHFYDLSDYELASRLSYFLWSSMPDDQLLELARINKLRDPAVLKEQVARMLIDPKADALVKHFAGQWLLLRKLDGLEMDPKRFPSFDAPLREAMRQEAELFFADILRENKSVLRFLDSDTTFVNQRLAEHYGIAGVRGDSFRPIRLLDDSPRGGVLTMAATLTVTSHATRTSPVKRGDYVLGQLMGTAPPPPPPDVPPLEKATEQVGEEATLREQLAAHVADPNCAVCHKRLDPIGLAMENFTAIGAWRETEQGKPIDATGELPGGVAFNGPNELKAVMLERGDDFVFNLSRTMLTYAVGRGYEPFDRPTIQKIAQITEDDGYRMQALVQAVVLSDAFRKARGREPKP